MRQKYSHIIGIDEAGRGPLAGPVAVGVVCIPREFNWKCLPGVNDSKKLSPKSREAIFDRTQMLHKEGVLTYTVSMVSAPVIDRIGITKATELGINRSLKRLSLCASSTKVLLDGLLRSPTAFTHQKTIIKGDQHEKIIGLASIMAKVHRDRYMVRIGKKYPVYEFDVHKGYGTKKHIDALKKYGLCHIHRNSFTKRM